MEPDEPNLTEPSEPGSGAAWAGAVSAVFAAGSLAFHALALTLAGLVPSVLGVLEGELVKAELENGFGAAHEAPFAVVHEGLAELGPPVVGCLGLAVVLALGILASGVATTFRPGGAARRVLRAALCLEGLRALGWALWVEVSLGDRADAAAAALDKAIAPLTAGGGGLDQPGMAEMMAPITSTAATWLPSLLQVGIVVALFVWAGRGLRAGRENFDGWLAENPPTQE